MAKRWTCPKCKNTIIAPNRIPDNDARKFCLPCSNKKMVERVCVADIKKKDSLKKKRNELKKKENKKRQEKLKKWDNVYNQEGWNRASATNDPHQILRYVFEQSRLAIRPDFVGGITLRQHGTHDRNLFRCSFEECNLPKRDSPIREVWLINKLRNHPLHAVYLGLMNSSLHYPVFHRVKWGHVWEWISKELYSWEHPLQQNFNLTSSTHASRKTQQEARDFLREGFENWFEENWQQVVNKYLPKLTTPISRTKGTRKTTQERAKWMVGPLPLVWRLPY